MYEDEKTLRESRNIDARGEKSIFIGRIIFHCYLNQNFYKEKKLDQK